MRGSRSFAQMFRCLRWFGFFWSFALLIGLPSIEKMPNIVAYSASLLNMTVCIFQRLTSIAFCANHERIIGSEEALIVIIPYWNMTEPVAPKEKRVLSHGLILFPLHRKGFVIIISWPIMLMAAILRRSIVEGR